MISTVLHVLSDMRVQGALVLATAALLLFALLAAGTEQGEDHFTSMPPPTTSSPSSAAIVSPTPISEVLGVMIMPSRTSVKYRVGPGDSLSMIADLFGTSVEVLRELNDVGDLIGVGDVLVIPRRKSAPDIQLPERALVLQSTLVGGGGAEPGQELWVISRPSDGYTFYPMPGPAGIEHGQWRAPVYLASEPFADLKEAELFLVATGADGSRVFASCVASYASEGSLGPGLSSLPEDTLVLDIVTVKIHGRE